MATAHRRASRDPRHWRIFTESGTAVTTFPLRRKDKAGRQSPVRGLRVFAVGTICRPVERPSVIAKPVDTPLIVSGDKALRAMPKDINPVRRLFNALTARIRSGLRKGV
jgi:hypothetical protein